MSYQDDNKCSCNKHKTGRRYHYHIHWADEPKLNPIPYGAAWEPYVLWSNRDRKSLYMVRKEGYCQVCERGTCKHNLGSSSHYAKVLP